MVEHMSKNEFDTTKMIRIEFPIDLNRSQGLKTCKIKKNKDFNKIMTKHRKKYPFFKRASPAPTLSEPIFLRVCQASERFFQPFGSTSAETRRGSTDFWITSREKFL